MGITSIIRYSNIEPPRTGGWFTGGMGEQSTQSKPACCGRRPGDAEESAQTRFGSQQIVGRWRTDGPTRCSRWHQMADRIVQAVVEGRSSAVRPDAQFRPGASWQRRQRGDERLKIDEPLALRRPNLRSDIAGFRPPALHRDWRAQGNRAKPVSKNREALRRLLECVPRRRKSIS